MRSADEYIGKNMDMQQLRSIFPDAYIALEDYSTDGYSSRGVLRFVCDSQMEMLRLLQDWTSHGNKKLYYTYTTESEELNGLWQL